MPPAKEIIDRTLASPQGELAYSIVEKFTDVGHEAWWVGGAVRDMLLGKIPHDIDIATSALPDQVIELFPKRDDAGKQFGSVFVLKGKRKCEITTFREDDEASDGRHPESVVFGARSKDSERRDFTINALYWNPINRELWDPHGGEEDLKEKLVRFIGEPAMRIKHDALRMLRAVRFRAAIEGQYHPETYKALQEQAELVEILSGTRQLQELERMLLCPHPDRALEDLWEIGMLKFIIPELHDCRGVPQPKDYHHEGDVWEHILRCARSFHPDHGLDVRLAAIFHDIGKVQTFSLRERIRFDHHASVSAESSAKIFERLQMTAKRSEKICWIIKQHMTMSAFIGLNEERKAHWYFHPWFSELLQLFWLDIAGTDPADFSLYDRIVKDYHAFLDSHPRPEKPLLSGQEIMDLLELQPGEKVGEAMELLHDAQVRKEVRTKAEAKAFLKKQIS